jgi:hypothetical protein
VRGRLIWAAIVLPASIYLLLFFTGGSVRFAGRSVDLTSLGTVVSRCVPILTVMAVGLGVINLFGLHGANLLRRRKEWPLSLVVCITFALTAWACISQQQVDKQRRGLEEAARAARERVAEAQAIDAPAERDAALAAISPGDWQAIAALGSFEDAYHFEARKFYVNYVNSPLAATVMALLGFYITFAAYRAFRIRTLEATVMMLSAAVVILGSDPLGGTVSQGVLTDWADFDNRVINSGMQRGLKLGIAVAAIAVSLRILLGLERGIIDVRQGKE